MKASPREHSLRLLDRVLNHGAYSNVLLAKTLSDPKLTVEHRRRITALTLGALRNYILLDRLLRDSAERKWKARNIVHTAGLLGAFEILFFENVPSYAAVNEYVKTASARSSRRETSFLNACLRRISEINLDDFLKSISDPVERLAVETSHPAWFVRRIIEHYGQEQAVALLRAAVTPLPFYLRVNTIRASTEDAVRELLKSNINAKASGSPPECVAVAPGEGRFPKAEYENGLVTPQDRSTQFVPHFLSLEPRDEVLDLCCGSGMKTTHIAEIQKDSGRITAADRSAAKIRALRSQARRLGIDSIRAATADILEKPSLGSYRKVLIDVPCSGSGVFRRRPEIKLRITPDAVQELAEIQNRLLCTAARYVEDCGFMLYATCSIMPEENENAVRRFLKTNSKFKIRKPGITSAFGAPLPVVELDEGVLFTPHGIDACGVFIALLETKA